MARIVTVAIRSDHDDEKDTVEALIVDTLSREYGVSNVENIDSIITVEFTDPEEEEESEGEDKEEEEVEE